MGGLFHLKNVNKVNIIRWLHKRKLRMKMVRLGKIHWNIVQSQKNIEFCDIVDDPGWHMSYKIIQTQEQI